MAAAHENVGLTPHAAGGLILALRQAIDTGRVHGQVPGTDSWYAPDPVPASVEVHAEFAEMDQVVFVATRTATGHLPIPVSVDGARTLIEALQAGITHLAQAN
ncbi:MAG TPA: hypothetical protein VJT31_28520 [Rugosimonospora sp.]|nr:hypothetical protein [Rugosimonospora sp.]